MDSYACAELALTKPSTATAFSLRLRLQYKAARVGGVRSKYGSIEIIQNTSGRAFR